MINALGVALVVSAVLTMLERRWLSKAPGATRWLFGLLLLLSISLYVYQAPNTHVWRPGELLHVFAPPSGPP
ncbi:MAG TPA: hypothetical protein VD973_19275 [Symbiobacteriaceae bacterium]|nr:hypothetical protein [Symbiobacteriaceae bacterium]